MKKKINSENTVSNEGCLYQNACGYIKMNAVVHGVGNALGKFFWKKGHDLSQLLIVVKRHWKKK